MKKLVLGLVGALLSFHSNAQIFSEDFSNGIPNTFTLVNVDGKTPNTNVGYVNNAWVARTIDGNGLAVSTSWYTPVGAADDWMITPSISITSANTYLVWKAGAPDQSYPDGYEVLISTTGNTVADFTNPPAYTNPGESAPFVTRVLDLSSYSGQSVYIAFRNNSNDQFLLYVDDILVDVFSGYDVAGSAVDLPSVVTTGSNLSINATFVNQGGPFGSADFNYMVNGGAVNTMSLSNLGANPTASISATHSASFTPSADGAYEIKLWMDNIDGNADQNNSNDTITKVVYAVSNPPSRKVVIEEKTGTWCGWCPRGTVGMYYMATTYPNSCIPIAVHNGDPMVVNNYDSNIGTVAPGGYPGSAVDRVLGPDPNRDDLEDAHDERLDAVPAADVAITGHTYNASSGAITLDVQSTFALAGNNLDYRYALVVVEDSVTGSSAGYAQVNYYSSSSQNLPLTGAGRNWQTSPNPVPASQMVYDHVARGIFPGFFGAAGSVPATIAFNQTVNYTFSINLPSAVNNDAKVHLVVMLLNNDTYEVVNAESIALGANVSLNETSGINFEVFPNPASDVVKISGIAGKYEVSLINSVGQVVKTAGYSSDAELNLESLDAGVYILQVMADGVSESRRISIVR